MDYLGLGHLIIIRILQQGIQENSRRLFAGFPVILSDHQLYKNVKCGECAGRVLDANEAVLPFIFSYRTDDIDSKTQF